MAAAVAPAAAAVAAVAVVAAAAATETAPKTVPDLSTPTPNTNLSCYRHIICV